MHEVKIPKLRIAVQEDDRFSLGVVSAPLILGFGAHLAWMYLAMFSVGVLNPSIDDGVSSLFYCLSLLALFLWLFSYAFWSRSFRLLFKTRRRRIIIRFIGAAAAAGGTAALSFAVSAEASLPLILFCGIATGIGSGVLLMSFGVSFGVSDIATIVTSTALSLVTAFIIYAVIIALSAFNPLGVILTALIPLFECFCLYRSSSTTVDRMEFSNVTMKVRKLPFAARLCLPSLLFGFTLSLMRSASMTQLSATHEMSGLVMCIAVGSIAASAIMLIVLVTQEQRLNFMFRPIVPLIAIALAVYAYFGQDHNLVGPLVLLFGYILFEGIMWAYYSDMTQRYRLTAFIVFGFGRGSLALGAFIGSSMMTIAPFDYSQAASVVAGMTALLLGYVLMPTEHELTRLIIHETDNPIEEAAAERRIEPSPAASPEAIEAKQKGRFKRKCEIISNRYLLSKRETELLFLLAKGRNAATIEEQLYISEGTVRTHMRHIYNKLDVHTQQELMDLVEAEIVD